MIIFKMIKYKIQRKRMPIETTSNDADSMRAVLISISLLFLATQVPALAVGMVRRNLQDVPRSEEFLYRFYIIDGICKLLKDMNHAVNFFCYCIAGRKFREELVAMMMFCFTKGNFPNTVRILVKLQLLHLFLTLFSLIELVFNSRLNPRILSALQACKEQDRLPCWLSRSQ